MMNVAMTEEFNEQWNTLEKNEYKNVGKLIQKLRTNSTSKGVHVELIHRKGVDTKIRSAKVSDAYRAILTLLEKDSTWLLLWVDHHDEAYAWAENKKIEINPQTKVLQLFRVIEAVETPAYVPKLFDKFTNEQLISLGLPEPMLPFVRSLTEIGDFYEHRMDFPNDAFEYLDLLAKGNKYSEVLAFMESVIKDDENKGVRFKILDDEEELKRMLEAPLEKWRIFLHPDQKRLVGRDFSGPARVSGEAGTGKTVVAMHRTKYLLGKGNRVLFVTFTKNLVGDIEENLKTMLSMDEIKRLDVESVDSIIYNFVRSHLPGKTIVYNENVLLQCWKEAIKLADAGSLGLKPVFYKSEWELIATPMDGLESINYLSINRKGRGVRLDRQGRLKVWRVFEEYMSLLEKEDKLDPSYAAFKARQILKKTGKGPYDSIVIDEGQDIGANAYRFLRQYAGAEHPNDIFVAGDSRQRIYKHKAVLSKCGIKVVGRSSILHVNYRTTEETREFACKVLEGEDWESNREFASSRLTSSLTSGDKPLVRNFTSFDEQMDFVQQEIESLVKSGAKLEDICLTARSNAQVSEIKGKLTDMGILCNEILADKGDNMNVPGVRLATMHRIKGLEFRHVFLLSVNEGMGVAASTDDGSEEKDNELIEKSLLYVALTRASIKAYVLSYGKPSPMIAKP